MHKNEPETERHEQALFTCERHLLLGSARLRMWGCLVVYAADFCWTSLQSLCPGPLETRSGTETKRTKHEHEETRVDRNTERIMPESGREFCCLAFGPKAILKWTSSQYGRFLWIVSFHSSPSFSRFGRPREAANPDTNLQKWRGREGTNHV